MKSKLIKILQALGIAIFILLVLVIMKGILYLILYGMLNQIYWMFYTGITILIIIATIVIYDIIIN